MLEIDFQQIDFLSNVANIELLEKIESVIQYTYELQHELKNKNLEMSIIFTNDAEIKKINAEYRQKDVATDVISFAFTDIVDEIIYDESMPQILGEIFISVERAEEQAKEYGHSFERELVFLALHGFLHLLGYDHIEEVAAQEMFALQDEILTKLEIHR